MNNLEKMETIVGGKIERRERRTIPGTVQVEGREVVYFSDNASGEPRRTQFHRLVRQAHPPLLKYGGSSELGCTVRSPDGVIFHGIAYHGDIEGWARQIGEGARQLGLLIGRIEDHNLTVSNGRHFALAACSIDFD